MIHTVSIIRRWLALAIFLLVGLAKVEAQYPANPQKPITYLNRAHSTQPGGLILFDDPVQFNAGVIGLSGTGLLTSGTSGPLYVDVTDWRAAFGQDTFLNWNGNAELTVNTSGSTGNVDGLIAHSGGTDGIPIVAWSQSGAPALLVTQDTAFDNPALAIYRSGTTGQTTDSPALLVQAGGETTGTNEVAQVGGCLALTGDNWDIFWGDGGLSLSGGLLDNTGKTHGFLALDPVHRQLVAEDGVTAVLTWTGTQAQVGNLVVTSSFSAPSAFTSQFLTASSGTGFATAAQGAKASSALQSGSSSAPGLTVTRSGTTFTLTGTATNALYLTGSSALNAANLSGTDANQVTFSNYIFSDGIYDTSGAGYTEQGPGGYVDLGGGGFIDQTGTGGFNGLTIKSPGSPLTTGTFIMPNGVGSHRAVVQRHASADDGELCGIYERDSAGSYALADREHLRHRLTGRPICSGYKGGGCFCHSSSDPRKRVER